MRSGMVSDGAESTTARTWRIQSGLTGLSDDGFGICGGAAESRFGAKVKLRSSSYSMPLNHHWYDSSIKCDLVLNIQQQLDTAQ